MLLVPGRVCGMDATAGDIVCSGGTRVLIIFAKWYYIKPLGFDKVGMRGPMLVDTVVDWQQSSLR